MITNALPPFLWFTVYIPRDKRLQSDQTIQAMKDYDQIEHTTYRKIAIHVQWTINWTAQSDYGIKSGILSPETGRQKTPPPKKNK